LFTCQTLDLISLWNNSLLSIVALPFRLETMVSNESFTSFIKLITIGNKCGMLPLKWDLKRNKLILARRLKHTIFLVLTLAHLLFIIGYTALNYKIVSDTDLIIVLFILLSLTEPIYVLVWMFNWNQYSTVLLLNANFDFNRFQRKYFHTYIPMYFYY